MMHVQTWKLIGDAYRYVCEIIKCLGNWSNFMISNEKIKDWQIPRQFKDMDCLQSAKNSYEKAIDLLEPLSRDKKDKRLRENVKILKLTIKLNQQVLVYEIEGERREAIQALEAIFEKNLKKLNDLNDEEVNNLAEVMNMIEQNIQIWKKESQEGDKKSRNYLISKKSKGVE